MSNEPKLRWGLLWRGLKPQLVMLAIVIAGLAIQIFLAVMGWYPDQTVRE